MREFSIVEIGVQWSEVMPYAVENGHLVEMQDMAVIDRESNWRKWIVKEALWTRNLTRSNKIMHEIGVALMF